MDEDTARALEHLDHRLTDPYTLPSTGHPEAAFTELRRTMPGGVQHKQQYGNVA